MRSLLLALALAPAARGAAMKMRTPRDAAAAFFHSPASVVLHWTAAKTCRWKDYDSECTGTRLDVTAADARGAGAFSTLLLVGSMLVIAAFIVGRKATRAAESEPLLATTA